MHTLKRNWARPTTTRLKITDVSKLQLKSMDKIPEVYFLVQCKHRHMLSIYCRDASIEYLMAVETRKLRPLFTMLSRLHSAYFVSRSKMRTNFSTS